METRSKRKHRYELRSCGLSKPIKIKPRSPKKPAKPKPKPKESDKLIKAENQAHDNDIYKRQCDIRFQGQENSMSIGASFAALDLRHAEKWEQIRKESFRRRLGPPGSAERKKIMKHHHDRMRKYSNQAIEFYRERGGGDFELVDALSIGQGILAEGCVRHINFEAREKSDPNKLVLMFFAELMNVGIGKERVDMCFCLGAADKQPDYGDTQGCTFCSLGAVHHPARVKFRGTIYG